MDFFSKGLNYYIRNKSEIYPEDTLSDSRAEDLQSMEAPLRKKHFRWLYSLVIAMLVILLFRCGWLQIYKGDYFQAKAFENKIQVEKIQALRGIIYDYKNHSLVQNIPSAELTPLRYYPDGQILAHLIGYINKIDKNGQTGLELIYENELKGKPGQKYLEVDSSNQAKGTIAIEEPEPGNNLVLHLDLDLQRKIYDLLKDKQKAVALAMNPKNGGVMALVSIPSFDNNLFAQGISAQEYQRLKDDPISPFFNRAISGEYAPGSTIKPLIALAGLTEGVINPDETINDDKGFLKITHQYDPNIVYIFPDWKIHGPIKMRRAIAESCNVYFYTLGQRLGFSKIKEYADLFGLGKKTGIDLPGESIGFVPQQGSIGDLYHTSIGQGDITLTPLQLLIYTAAIANGGKLYQPQVVDKILDEHNNLLRDIEPRILQENFIDDAFIKVIQEGMAGITDSSFGWRLRDLPQKIAGKTGTAQFGKEGKTHSWFSSYGPIANPEITLVVLIEGGGSGSEAALPIAKEIYQWYYERSE